MANIGVVLNENDSIIRNYIDIDTDVLNKNSSIKTSALHIAAQNLSTSEKNQVQSNIGVQSLFSNALKKTDASLSTSEKNQILSNLGIQSVKNIIILTETPDDSYGNNNDIVIKLSNYVPKMNEMYLTFEALGSGTFSFSKDDPDNDIYYRKNGGTWNVYSSSISVNEGDTVEWKGSLVSTPDSSKGIGTFSSSCYFNAYGNIMSLLYNDNFTNKFNLSDYPFAFKNLFASNINLINTNNLILPATTLANNCYQYMFYNCIRLTTAPELSATTLTNSCYNYMFYRCIGLTTAPELSAATLADYCYSGMFYGCTGLTTAPKLPATTLASSCYGSMFYGCTGLTTAPELPATTLATSCYNSMFYGCIGLTTAPELPATTLASGCYYYMFYNCTRLTTAPELPATTLTSSCYTNMFRNCTGLIITSKLPATTLASSCYSGMFYGCTGLTTAPELPATTLADYCYSSIFRNCTSLTTAPELPATTLASSCYSYMFYGCSSLNYIKALFTTTPGSTYTASWVNGVAASGMFVKSDNATWDVTGVNGVPTNWVIKQNKKDQYLTFHIYNNSNGSEQTVIEIYTEQPTVANSEISYSTDDGETWTSITNTNSNTSSGHILFNYLYFSDSYTKILFKGKPLNTSFCFKVNMTFDIEGNIRSIVNGDDFMNDYDATYFLEGTFKDNTTLRYAHNLVLPSKVMTSHDVDSETSPGYGYHFMFFGCSNLITAPDLPATTLSPSCYAEMFFSCQSLINPPELPATTMVDECYASMFHGCVSLTTAPKLPSTTLAYGCYANMFTGCQSLITPPELPATTLEFGCYQSMFNGCTSLITGPKLPATTLARGCYSSMFQNCTGLTTVPELPATTLAYNCYYAMFNGCISLTTAPELPATTLASSCYSYMFYGCSSLNYIKALFTTTPGSTYTASWVNGVAASGMFVKSDNATWDVTGVNGVPTNWTIITEYESHYLTFEAVTPCSFTFIYRHNSSEYLYYSIDDGKTWEALTLENYTPTINVGEKILWKCNSSLSSGDEINIGIFNSIGEYNVEGNIMSLLYGDNFIGQKELTSIGVFTGLFLNNNTNATYIDQSINNIIDASKLVLPAMTLTDACYSGMFQGCTSLITAPKLPATTLVNGCYSYMFYECTSLITAPELLATTLASSCYETMFGACTSLVNAPKKLPATTLADYCYNSMFAACTSLEISPILPNATLFSQCYEYMFYNCTSLSTIICLINTKNVGNSFNNYFKNWVYNVNDTGTFICNNESDWPNGDNGIPNNWIAQSIDNTVNITQPWSNISSDNYITVSNALYVSIHLSANQTMYISKDHTNWKQMVSDTYYDTEKSPVYICGYLSDDNNIDQSDFSYFKFIGYYIEVTGNCNSVWNYNNIDAPLKVGCGYGLFSFCDTMVTPPELPATVLADYCYGCMFGGARDSNGNDGFCTSLQHAPELPAIVLADSCYTGMFTGCTSLVNAPKKLPATTLTDYCYQQMFYGCTSLITAPELPATTLTASCYYRMFYGCTSLNYIKALFTGTESGTFNSSNSSSYTYNWVNGVSNFGVFIKNDDATWNLSGNNGVPNSWGIETYNIYGLRIWVDDFVWADYKLADIIEDPDHTIGSDCYTLTNETIQINNVTYYLWEGNNTGGDFKYLLTTSNDYNTLYNQSMEKDASNEFTSFYSYLDSDYIDRYYPSDPRQLIKIENNNGFLTIWVDDFWYEYNLSDWINDPENLGCNPYELLIGEPVVFDNKAYYVWKYTGDSYAPPYLFTSAGDYDTLYNQSMKANAINTFDSFYSFAWEDNGDLYNDSYVIDKQRLLKVEKI